MKTNFYIPNKRSLVIMAVVLFGCMKGFSQSLQAFELQFKARNFGMDFGITARTGWKSAYPNVALRVDDVFKTAAVDSASGGYSPVSGTRILSPEIKKNWVSWMNHSFIERSATLFSLELGTIKDPKEQLVVNERLIGSRPFKLNKISHTWMLKPSVGKVWSISERTSRNDVGFRAIGNLGLPVAYSWPIYIWLYKPNFLIDGYVDAKYDPGTQLATEIGGTAAWSKGFKQGTWIPGMSCSGGFQFEWGSYKQITNTFTLGCSLDYFAKKIPNWYNHELNRNIFPAVFVTFAAGIAKD